VSLQSWKNFNLKTVNDERVLFVIINMEVFALKEN
jgi:hypothetical protein